MKLNIAQPATRLSQTKCARTLRERKNIIMFFLSLNVLAHLVWLSRVAGWAIFNFMPFSVTILAHLALFYILWKSLSRPGCRRAYNISIAETVMVHWTRSSNSIKIKLVFVIDTRPCPWTHLEAPKVFFPFFFFGLLFDWFRLPSAHNFFSE